MKQANLAFMIALGVVAILIKILLSRAGTNSAPTTAAAIMRAPASVPVLPGSAADPITEAAYNVQPTDFAPATGGDENTGGEVISFV